MKIYTIQVSELGIDGEIEIKAPEENVSDSLQALPQTVRDASSLMKKPCIVVLSEENPSRFVIKQLQGIPPTPYDRQGSGVLAKDDWIKGIF